METKELTVPERAAVALGTPKYEQEIRDLVAKSVTITEVKNKDGREQCHGAMMTLKSARVAIEKAAKGAREDATAFSKAVIAEEKRLVALAAPEEARLQVLRDAWDAEIEREKAAKLAAEQQRVAAIRTKIDAIRSTPARWLNKPSQEIGAAADHLSETVISLEEWAEFGGEAMAERDNAVKQMREMQAKQLEVEQEQARLAAERAELDRLRAEQEERGRVAAAARAAQEAKDRAERERIEAEQRAAQERAAAAMRSEQEAHEARMREQQAELARQQAEIDRQRAEAERVERERQEAIAAEERRKREETEAAQRLESDHAEALIENARRDAEAAERAAEQERARRARVDFERNGPGDVEIVKTLAHHYGVVVGDVMQWMKKFDYEAADEQLAAENMQHAA